MTQHRIVQTAAVETAIQQILEQSESADVDRCKEIKDSVVEALTAAAEPNISSDILAQALANSGLETGGERDGPSDSAALKERLVSAVSQAFAEAEPVESTTRLFLSDSASGIKRTTHTVRRVSYSFLLVFPTYSTGHIPTHFMIRAIPHPHYQPFIPTTSHLSPCLTCPLPSHSYRLFLSSTQWCCVRDYRWLVLAGISVTIAPKSLRSPVTSSDTSASTLMRSHINVSSATGEPISHTAPSWPLAQLSAPSAAAGGLLTTQLSMLIAHPPI